MAAVLVDTGVLVASVLVDDAHHRDAADWLTTTTATRRVPVMCMAEAAHLVASRAGHTAEAALLVDAALGTYIAEPVLASDWERIAALVLEYADLGLGAVDASIVAAAERLGVSRIATFDRRHFGVVRPRHVEAFELLP